MTRCGPVLLAVAACGLSFLFGSCRDAPSEQAPAAEPGATIDRIAERCRDERSIPGLAIAVRHRGEPVHVGSYGFADLGAEIPVEPATLFDLGSIKKHMTAAAIVQLTASGTLDPEDPLRRWLPAVPAGEPVVRLRHMLHQVSGLPELAVLTDDEVDPEALDRALARVQLEFAPGTRWAYRNANFDLLDRVVRAADGREFAAYLAEELTGPLGLATPAMCRPDAPEPEPARGYTVRDGAMVAVDEPSCWQRGTASDLVGWFDALMRGRVVAADGLRAMTSWVRLFDGRFRDPLVGRDVLIGLVLGTGLNAIGRGISGIAELLDLPSFDGARSA